MARPNTYPKKTSFPAGAGFMGDSDAGLFFMEKNPILAETAQNALAGNVAPAFVPTRPSADPYKAGESVVYNGKIYTFRVSHYGPWNANDVDLCPDLLMKVLTRQIFDSSGYNVSDLNSSPINSLQFVQKTASTQTSNFPSDYPNGKLGILSTIKEFYSGSTFQIFQLLFVIQDKVLYRRTYNSGNNTWSAWTKSDFIGTDALSAVEFVNKYQIFDGNLGNLDDLNNAADNTTYVIIRTTNTQTLHFPADYPTENSGTGFLTTYKAYYDATHYTINQLLLRFAPAATPSVTIYRRGYNSGNNTWSAWTTIQLALKTDIENSAFVSKYQIFDGFGYNLDDLNNAEDNTSYLIARTANTATLNFPPQYPVSGGGTGLLTTYKAYYDGTHYQKCQILERFGVGGATTTIYRRAYNSGNNTWSAWVTHNLSPDVIKVGAGQQYTTLRAAFEAAYNAGGNQQIFVMPGTYDLSVEFSDILASITTDVGLPVGNGMHIIFADGTKVTANFVKGDLTDAQWEKLRTYFAPIWCRAGDFVIENMTIEATDCRYCVHDERGQNTVPYVHKFINCKMKKSSTTSDRVYAQCIGGGLGSHGTIIVDGGYYESNPTYGSASVDGGEPTSAQGCISYHNDGYDSNAESSVTIKNVYFANRGYATIYNYGTTTKKTRLYINGCSLGLPVLKTGANSTAVVDNTEVVDWNNAVRNQQHWEPISNYQVDLVDDNN